MKRFLIIDDRSDDPGRLREILRSEGYGVTEAPGWPGFLSEMAGSPAQLRSHPAAGTENPLRIDLPQEGHSGEPGDAVDSNARLGEWPGLLLPEAALLMSAGDSVVVDINAAFAEMTGYERHEIVGQTALGLFFFLNPELWSQAFRTLLATGGPHELEARIMRKDRQIAFVRISLRIVEVDGMQCHLATIRDITDNIAAQNAALREQRLPCTGPESLLPADDDMDKEDVGRIIDSEDLQDLMNSFYKIAKFGIGIIDLKGNIHVATGWQDICTRFHRIHPEALSHCIESDMYLSRHVGEGKYSLYKCRNNLWDMATPIMIGGRHIANIFLGQFLFDDEAPDYGLFRKQAEFYGFETDEYLAALERVPRWSRESVENVMEFYSKLAVMISRLSLGNIRLARTLAEQERVKEALGLSELKYRAIIDKAPFGIFRSTVEGKFISVNPTLAAMLGYDSAEELLQACNDSSISDKLYLDPEERNSLVASVLREGGWQVRQNSYRRKDGRIITGNIYIQAAPNPESGGIELEGFVEDITERMGIEEELRQANLVVENSPVVLFRWRAAEGWPVEMVSGNVTQFGYTPEEFLSGALPFASIIHPDDLERVGGEVSGHSQQGADQFQQDYRILTRDGDVRWVYDRTVIERDLEGSITHYQGIVIDISERKLAEKALCESTERLQSIFRVAPIGIGVVRDRVLLEANRRLTEITGYTQEELVGRSARILYRNQEEFERVGRDKYLQIGELGSGAVETRWQRKDGAVIDVLLSSTPLDPPDLSKGVIFTALDITERKRAVENIRAALMEKEVLLKEVHHRVKNNMQIITTLLDLQSDSIDDKQAVTAFRDSQDRIRAMALVHEQLYQSRDLAHIDFGEYIENLAAFLFNSYMEDSERITLKVDAGQIALEIDRAIPCGLIVNELVSNSLKHAFPGGRHGEITVRLHGGDDGRIFLTVADNGTGLPPGVDFRDTSTLGLQLVNMLTRQLRGRVEMSGERGTSWEITFSTMDNASI
jgi:PAS domain S-box-containing protein